MRIPATALLILLPFLLNAQTGNDSTGLINKVFSFPSRSFSFLSKKYNSLTQNVERKTLKALSRMQQREDRLRAKIAATDSVKAQQLFGNAALKYQSLESRIAAPLETSKTATLKEYIPGVDSMQTTLAFLSTKSLPGVSVNSADLSRIGSLQSEMQQLQGRLQQANEAQDFLRERESQLKTQLSGLGLTKQLVGMNKEVYNYQEQLRQYKEILNDKEKLEQEVLSKATQIPAFKRFWQQNSIFASLFPMPQSVTNDPSTAVLGLPTRSQVQAAVIGQAAPAQGAPAQGSPPQGSMDGGSPSGALQQQITNGQDQAMDAQGRLSQLGGGGSASNGNATMPDYTPNSQRTKTFFKRIFSFYSFQTESATPALPAIANIGAGVGYKLSDKMQFGFGAAYRLGMGRSLNDISFSSQGVSLRSFLNMKFKGSLWISGGYEGDYLQAFSKLRDLKIESLWQKSALLGLMKKYKIGKKEADITLLYDFLAATHKATAQPLVFRIGRSF